MILGDKVESALRQSLTLSDGRFGIFIENPICCTFLVLTAVSIALAIYGRVKAAADGSRLALAGDE